MKPSFALLAPALLLSLGSAAILPLSEGPGTLQRRRPLNPGMFKQAAGRLTKSKSAVQAPQPDPFKDPQAKPELQRSCSDSKCMDRSSGGRGGAMYKYSQDPKFMDHQKEQEDRIRKKQAKDEKERKDKIAAEKAKAANPGAAGGAQGDQKAGGKQSNVPKPFFSSGSAAYHGSKVKGY